MLRPNYGLLKMSKSTSSHNFLGVGRLSFGFYFTLCRKILFGAKAEMQVLYFQPRISSGTHYNLSIPFNPNAGLKLYPPASQLLNLNASPLLILHLQILTHQIIIRICRGRNIAVM